ncbi:tRNA_int_end_N2 domain-containing protein [Durusdinium trenchii]|uniref:tRNA_int_end_N2 domain-containing protein n=1 Tax=Durusdinium trenchii TaxID=1381693 RepID=A0ABP0L7J2_9DINO
MILMISLALRLLQGHTFQKHLAVDSYMVYAHLRRSGYKVSRPDSHASQHEWELLFQPSDCGPCRVHVVRPDEPILQSLCNGLATWEGQSESLQNSVDQASLRVAVAQSALGSPAFLEICRPSCPRDTDRNSDAAELEAPNLLRADAELRAAEEALPPSGRYAALLERVVQLGSAETGRSKVTSHGAKIAEENAWL